jgi:hypothetical protein
MRPLKVPDVDRPRRHSTGTPSSPWPTSYVQALTRMLEIRQKTIAANQASAAVIRFEGERALREHNKKHDKKRLLREANIRLRHKYPDQYPRSPSDR